MAISYPVSQSVISTTGWGIPVTDEINRMTPLVVAPTAWTNVTFQNGWSNFAGYTTKYRRIGDIVYMQGGVQGGAIGSAIFYLPPGFRPASTVQFAQPSYAILGIINVGSDGTVYPLSPTDTRFVGCSAVFATT